MAYVFKPAEYLDDKKEVRVFQVQGDFITIHSRHFLMAAMLNWFKNEGYRLVSTHCDTTHPFGRWDQSHLTNFEKIPSSVVQY